MADLVRPTHGFFPAIDPQLSVYQHTKISSGASRTVVRPVVITDTRTSWVIRRPVILCPRGVRTPEESVCGLTPVQYNCHIVYRYTGLECGRVPRNQNCSFTPRYVKVSDFSPSWILRLYIFDVANLLSPFWSVGYKQCPVFNASCITVARWPVCYEHCQELSAVIQRRWGIADDERTEMFAQTRTPVAWRALYAVAVAAAAAAARRALVTELSLYRHQ